MKNKILKLTKERSKCQEISSEDMKLNKNIRNNRQQTREEQLNDKCAEIEKLQNIDATGMHKKIKKEKKKQHDINCALQQNA